MELLRTSEADLTIEVDVDQPNTQYEYLIRDLADLSETTGTVTSSSTSKVSISFEEDHDCSYILQVDGANLEVDVVRPYTDIVGETATEIAEYKKNERIARAIIDSIVPEGFYFRKRIIETTGIGSDYLPVWNRVRKLLKLYENNVLVFDSDSPDDFQFQYGLTDDRTAIVQLSDERVNRLEGAALVMPAGGSDLLDVKYTYRGFPKTFDYKMLVEEGYSFLPEDIKIAAQLLIEDIACGKLEYFKRYVTDYKTDQFNIRIDGQAFEGTGNLIVDKILSKYSKSITSIGVL